MTGIPLSSGHWALLGGLSAEGLSAPSPSVFLGSWKLIHFPNQMMGMKVVQPCPSGYPPCSLSLILFCKRHLSQMSKSVTSGDIQPDNNSGSLSPPLPYSEERGLPLTGNVKFSIMTWWLSLYLCSSPIYLLGRNRRGFLISYHLEISVVSSGPTLHALHALLFRRWIT